MLSTDLVLVGEETRKKREKYALCLGLFKLVLLLALRLMQHFILSRFFLKSFPQIFCFDLGLCLLLVDGQSYRHSKKATRAQTPDLTSDSIILRTVEIFERAFACDSSFEAMPKMDENQRSFRVDSESAAASEEERF